MNKPLFSCRGIHLSLAGRNILNDVDVAAYTTVLVWCEAFSEFITAGKYR